MEMIGQCGSSLGRVELPTSPGTIDVSIDVSDV
jgi:hypothetical protein